MVPATRPVKSAASQPSLSVVGVSVIASIVPVSGRVAAFMSMAGMSPEVSDTVAAGKDGRASSAATEMAPVAAAGESWT